MPATTTHILPAQQDFASSSSTAANSPISPFCLDTPLSIATSILSFATVALSFLRALLSAATRARSAPAEAAALAGELDRLRARLVGVQRRCRRCRCVSDDRDGEGDNNDDDRDGDEDSDDNDDSDRPCLLVREPGAASLAEAATAALLEVDSVRDRLPVLAPASSHAGDSKSSTGAGAGDQDSTENPEPGAPGGRVRCPLDRLTWTWRVGWAVCGGRRRMAMREARARAVVADVTMAQVELLLL